MNVFHIFLFLAPNRSHLPVVRYMWLQNGAIFRLWHQKWCRFREWNFCRGIKIDAILITSSLIPSRLSHLARVIFKKIIPSTYSQWEVTKLRVFFKRFFLSLIPSGKGIFLSSFQKNSAHLTHIWKPFCQPIRRGFLLQFLTATFATEKRHDFWKNFSFNPIPQLSKPKNDIFSETFSKNVLTPLPHVFGQKTDTLFQKSFPKSVPQVFLSKSQHPSRKSIKNSACLVFRSRRYIFSGIQL